MRDLKLLPLALTTLLVACGGGGTVDDDDDDPIGPGGDPPSITSVTPDPLLEGGTATIVGANFSATPGSNLVRIDGTQAVVTQASATQLTVNVPVTCGATRSGTVTVTVSSRTSPGVTVQIEPNARVADLELGEQAIYRGQSSYCVELPESDASVRYLVGIQSTSVEGGTKTGVRLQGRVGSSSAAAAPLPSLRSGEGLAPAPMRGPTTEFGRRIARHRRDHLHQLQRDLDFVRGLHLPGGTGGPATAPARAILTGDEDVGDRVDLRVLNHTAGGCDAFSPITAEVRVKTDNAYWLVDVSNPENGYSDEQLQQLATQFENEIWETDADAFGEAADRDGSGRIGIVITEVLNINNGNSGGTVGFVNICDGFDRDDGAQASNEGEFFYAQAPDPANEHGQQVGVDFLMEFMPFVLAHELTHVIQFSRRFDNQAGATTFILQDVFEAEGQATFAEEIVGHTILGNEPLQNYGQDLAWDFDDLLPFHWYFNLFPDLAFYYGANTSTGTRVSGAPEECTWTQNSQSDPDPCLSRPSWYGVTWSFIRWVADQYALEVGDPDQLQRDLIDSELDQFDNFRTAFSELGALEDLLAQWAATLYTDDRIDGNPNSRLTFPSWDLVDIESAVASWARLQPREHGFLNFTDNVTVRSPSMAYWVISGSSNPAMSLHATSATGNALPDHMQMWVVRMQ